MNRPSLLHIIERLEGFLCKLPETIQRPILQELAPLKELFLRQRAPRFVLTGSNRLPLQEIVAAMFAWTPPSEARDVLMELFRWHAMELGGRGTISFLDARGAEPRIIAKIQEELKAQPTDMLLHLAEDGSAAIAQSELENLAILLASSPAAHPKPRVVGVVLQDGAPVHRGFHNGDSSLTSPKQTRVVLQKALEEQPGVGEHLLQVVEISSGAADEKARATAQQFMSMLARGMPNEGRVEMARIANDRAVQGEVAQTLVKSTTAICAAIGAQPIPLADLPILTALQLLMVSGIMYISGRERSLRAATEFVGALGVNVGAGMILREGTRALLKFFPGWGNVVCGAVAGAGTYAMGRASIVYFLEGMTLKDARRTYLSSRKKKPHVKQAKVKELEATS